MKSPSFIHVLLPFIDRKVIPGAVTAVVGRDGVVALETLGVADLESGAPMRPDTMFWIASMTKPMTAVALMMLVDAGKVDVDDPVEKHLPEFQWMWVNVGGDDTYRIQRRPRNTLRIRHLMGHTSGMPGRAPLEPAAQDVLPLSTLVRIYAGTPLASEPGAKYAYGNPAINTVGRIIEVVSGVPYDTFMRTRVFEPLGMRDTCFVLNRKQVKRVAKVYQPNAAGTALQEAGNGYVTLPLDNPARQPFPGGGIYSTAGDVAAFAQMLLNQGVFKGKRLIAAKTLARFTRVTPGECAEGNYGLGFGLGGEDQFGHGGAFNTQMTIDPKRNHATVYLVQLSGVLSDAGSAYGVFRAAVEAASV